MLVTPSNSLTASSGSAHLAAARFCWKCATDGVPGRRSLSRRNHRPSIFPARLSIFPYRLAIPWSRVPMWVRRVPMLPRARPAAFRPAGDPPLAALNGSLPTAAEIVTD
jgi:hypothetical protein